MMNIRHSLARSEGRGATGLKALRRRVLSFSVPAPRAIVRPALWAFVALRATYHFLIRVFICEPLFKAYCTQYGSGLRTDCFVHWVRGPGHLVLGDRVVVDGKCGFSFAARYTAHPTMTVGDDTAIGNGCTFRVGKRITIGRDPVSRLSGLPPPADEVKPIVIGDNVWIGARCIVYPGVNIGEGTVVGAGSVVMASVPPFTLVSGNPARRVASLAPSVPQPSLVEAV